MVTLRSPPGVKAVVRSGLETLRSTCALRVVVVDIEVLFRERTTEALGGLVVDGDTARVALCATVLLLNVRTEWDVEPPRLTTSGFGLALAANVG